MVAHLTFFAPAAPTRPSLTLGFARAGGAPTEGLRPFDPQASVRWGLVAQFPAPLKKRGCAPVFQARRA